MSSRLLNLSADFAELLGPEQGERLDLDRDLARDLDANGTRHVSRQEDLMLGWANLFASAVFGPAGEFRKRE